MWDDRPFVPVGGVFQARSWSARATDSDTASDIAALTTLKESGVTDIYVQPSGGITQVPAARLQALVDALESLDFTYGIALNDGPRTPLIGTQILPSRYRAENVSAGDTVRFPMRNVSAAHFIAAVNSNDVIDAGDASVVEEGVRVTLGPTPNRLTIIVYPERIFFASDNLGLPNVWEGLETYRDSLLTLFTSVKLGKGFRFFTDPLPPGLDLSGEARQIVPSSAAFQSEWAAFLRKKYGNIGTLETRWRIQEIGLKDFTEAARLVAMWYGDRGVRAFYDRTTKERRRVDGGPDLGDAFWNDLDAFKLQTVRTAMSDLASALKRGIADVPVVYRSRGYSPLFAASGAANEVPDYNGIGIDAYGRGTEAVQMGAADIYAQVADAPRPLWLPVLATQETRLPEAGRTGFSSQQALFGLLDNLREIGARAFYVDGLRVIDAARQAFDLSSQPQQLAWLGEYAKMLQVTGISGAATPNDKAIFYPRQVASLVPIAPRPLGSGGWLLPTDRATGNQFAFYDFGPAGKAYGLNDNQGTVFYFWQPEGTRTVHLKLPKAALAKGAPPIQWLPVERGQRSKDTLTLTLGPEPIRVFNLSAPLVPVEAKTELLAEARRLVTTIKDRKLGDTTDEDALLTRLIQQSRDDEPEMDIRVVSTLNLQVERLKRRVRPYLWMEAEGDATSAAPTHNFDLTDTRAEASGGRVLLVRTRPEGMPPATATYSFQAPDGVYHLFIAATPGATFTVRVDGLLYGGNDVLTAPRQIGTPYAGQRLVWYDCGATTLSAGRHALEIRADSPLALDAWLLAPPGYTPRGIAKPEIAR
jgi:hypothetical protein